MPVIRLPSCDRPITTLLRAVFVFFFLSSFWPAQTVLARSVAAQTVGGRIIYVRQGAAGAGNGSSWSDAFPELRTALAITQAGDEVWVAAGTYLPGSAQTTTFDLPDGVAVYGGFSGSESSLSERRWQDHPTLLSGDIGIQGSLDDNTFHVVTASNVGPNTILDGFTISFGSALDVTSTGAYGGGLYLDNASPTLNNLIFTGNRGLGGGGMANLGGSPVLTQIVFLKNLAQLGGGLYDSYGASSLSQVTFEGNYATRGGGSMFIGGKPRLDLVTYRENSVGTSGGGLISNGSAYTLTRSVFIRNHAPYGAGIYEDGYSSPSLISVAFLGNAARDNGGAFHTAGYTTPHISNSIFAGNQAETGGGVYSTGSSAPYFLNTTFAGNQGGALYAYSELLNPTLINSIAWDNGKSPFYFVNNQTVTIRRSELEGGCPGTVACQYILANDPQFVRLPSPGMDEKWGTPDDDYGDLSLQLSSPAIDAGENAAVLPDIQTDAAGNPRFIDIPIIADSGAGLPPVVDMGAYEAGIRSSATEITSVKPDPAVVGQTVTVHFEVKGLQTVPDGLVTVSAGAEQCSAAVSTGSCSLTFQQAGVFKLRVQYSGNDTYLGSAAETDLTISPAGTSIALTNPPGVTFRVGETVQVGYQVQVTLPGSGMPTGEVEIRVGENSCKGTAGQDRCSLVLNKPGDFQLIALYYGDQNFLASTSEITIHVAEYALYLPVATR